MNDQIIKKVLLKNSIEDVFLLISEVLNIEENDRGILLSYFENSKDSNRKKIVLTSEEKNKLINNKLSSIVYQILKRNILNESFIGRHYSKKKDKGSKPSKMSLESRSKLKKILFFLVSKNKLLKTSKGYILDSSFKTELLAKLL